MRRGLPAGVGAASPTRRRPGRFLFWLFWQRIQTRQAEEYVYILLQKGWFISLHTKSTYVWPPKFGTLQIDLAADNSDVCWHSYPALLVTDFLETLCLRHTLFKFVNAP